MYNEFDERLNAILSKYECIPPEVIDGTLINSIIADAITKRCVDKNVAIWGVGKKNAVNGHCYMIIQKYILNLSGLKWLLDSDVDLQGTEFLGYPIIAPTKENIIDNKIDIIIIASKNSRKSIAKSIKEIAPRCEYLDVYEELEKEGIKIDFNFFSEQNIYTELYRYKHIYETADEEEDKRESLDKLIALYLKIRDFYYAEKYIKEYAGREYDKADSYIKMLDEIKQLCTEVKKINKDKKDNIIIHLIDSIRAMDVYGKADDGTVKLNLFKDYEDHAVIFSEAYSTGPVTYESMIGTIKQKLSFKENVYKDNNFIFDIDEFELLKMVHDKKMPIRFYISKDYQIMNPNPDIEFIEQLHMPEKLWTLATDIAVSNEPVFSMVYYPWELHFPMLCGYMNNEPRIKAFADVGIEDMSDFIENQLADCLDYVDKQFAYYREFFSENDTIAVIADHSQPIYDKNKFAPYFMFCNDKDRICHVTFMIFDARLKSGVYDNLISMLDFNKIIETAVFEHKVEIPYRDVVQYQFYNVQNRKLRERAMELGAMNYTEGLNCFLSKKYLYIKTGTGCRFAYNLNDISKDISDTEEGEKYIDYIEANYDTDFPDFWTIRHDIY